MAASALAQQQEETKGIRTLLRHTADRWAPFIPRGMDVEQVVQSAFLATRQNKTLLDCDPETIVQSVTKAVRLGLDIGTTCYLVPRKDKGVQKCTLVVGKDGVIQLIIGTGVVRHCFARCIYAKEPYRFVTGTQTIVEHRPIADPDERGPMIGAYVVFHMRGNDVQAFEMSLKEIDAIRKRFSLQWKDGPCPDWYAEKTVIIHGAQHLPKNPKLARITSRLSDDDEVSDDEPAYLEASHAPALSSAPAPLSLSAGPARPVAVATPEREAVRATSTAAPVEAKGNAVADQGTEPYADVRRDVNAPVPPHAVEEAKRFLATHDANAAYGSGQAPAVDTRTLEQRLAELPFQDDRELEG